MMIIVSNVFKRHVILLLKIQGYHMEKSNVLNEVYKVLNVNKCYQRKVFNYSK